MIGPLLIVLLLVILLVLELPIGYSFIIVGVVGLLTIESLSTTMGLITSVAHSSSTNYILTTVPMFILMAFYLDNSGIVPKIFEAAERWVSGIPGGLAIAATIANGGMAVLSGSSTASVVTMARISIPEMKERGYSDVLAIGTVCASGTFAIMFPPSVPLIIYGVITGTSIKDLFLAGILPGILTLIGYVIVIIAWVLYSPRNTSQETERYTWTERVVSLKPVWPALLIVAFALGSLYAGVVTPSEAGAMGALGAFLVGIVFADLDVMGIRGAHASAVELTGMIFIILIGAEMFGRYLTLTGAINSFVVWLSELPIPALYILLLVFVAYIALGAVMDQLAILIITLPVTFPLATSLGYEGVWFGIAIVKTVEVGLVTPPFGMNVFAATSAVDIDTTTGFKGAMRFLVVDVIVILLLILFPEITLWLPDQF